MNRRTLFKKGLGAAAAGLLPVGAGASTTTADAAAQAWKSYYAKTRVWGYVNRHSVTPGTPFNLMLSTGPGLERTAGVFRAFRIGAAPDGSDREQVLQSARIEVTQQPVQMTASSVGAAWPVSFEAIPTDGWRPGYYTLDFINEPDGWRDPNIAFIVVTDPARSGDVLVWLCTNTYQAYNAWGGGSLYESAFVGNRAQTVSFDRPTPPDFFEYDYYLVTWLERLAAERGLKVGYATNFDMHRDAGFADGYRLLISGCHNEYWSKEEFDHVYRRIFGDGRNTLFFGANTAYWQARYADIDRPREAADEGRQLVCYKSVDDPIRQRTTTERERLMLTTMKFRDFARRPETMLVGIAYQSYFQSFSDRRYAYTVVDTSLPFFEGTGYKPGDRTPEVVGYEWDNVDPDGDGKRLWQKGVSMIPELDRAAIKVLFRGTPVDLNDAPGTAEAAYFVSPAGARVFATGSIRWAWGLGKQGFEQDAFKAFNRNLVLHLLET